MELVSRVTTIPHWPLPAVRDLTRDGRWSTDDVSVLKLPTVQWFITGKMRTHGKHSKATITNKTRPAGSFSSRKPGGPPCRPGVLCLCLFSGYNEKELMQGVRRPLRFICIVHSRILADFKHLLRSNLKIFYRFMSTESEGRRELTRHGVLSSCCDLYRDIRSIPPALTDCTACPDGLYRLPNCKFLAIPVTSDALIFLNDHKNHWESLASHQSRLVFDRKCTTPAWRQIAFLLW